MVGSALQRVMRAVAHLDVILVEERVHIRQLRAKQRSRHQFSLRSAGLSRVGHLLRVVHIKRVPLELF